MCKSLPALIIRILLFSINLFILICAILLILFGIYLKKHGGLENIPVGCTSISLGVLLCFISFFGCYGACTGSPFLLKIYAVLLLILFTLQIILGIMAIIQIKGAEKKVDAHVTDLFDEFIKEDNKDGKQPFDELQELLNCCGPGSEPDGYKLYSKHGWNIPKSCCTELNDDEICNESNLNQVGCGGALLRKLKHLTSIIAGMAFGFGIVEAVLACFAIYIKNTLRE